MPKLSKSEKNLILKHLGPGWLKVAEQTARERLTSPSEWDIQDWVEVIARGVSKDRTK